MTCHICGDNELLCDCEETDDGSDTMTDLQAHNKGLCNYGSCRFCEDEMDD